MIARLQKLYLIQQDIALRHQSLVTSENLPVIYIGSGASEELSTEKTGRFIYFFSLPDRFALYGYSG
jgi:hypothetical protein